ncbi:MAG: nucleotide disphospho-sugar-binding domain-containing protein [Planctomycetota bacterium]
MKRFILSPIGSAGDVHPYIGLGVALRERGHEVEFLINGFFRDEVEKLGFASTEFTTAEEYKQLTLHPDVWHPRKGFSYLAEKLFAYAPDHYDVIREKYQPGTIVVTSLLGIGALIAQEMHDIPVVTLTLQPAAIWSDEQPPVHPGLFGPPWMRSIQRLLGQKLVLPWVLDRRVNRVRKQLGVNPIRDSYKWWNSKRGLVCLFPEWYCKPASDWPDVIQTDFPLWDAGCEDQLPSEVKSFLDAGTPPIVFTPGSANVHANDFFRESVAVCRKLGRRGIFLTKFHDQLPELPNEVRAFSYVPLGRLLPYCAGIVHHGGIGTLAQGFQAGIPQLVMALAYDQFDNGHRLQQSGAGAWLPKRRYKSDRVAKQLNELITNEDVLQRAKNISKKMDGQGLTRSAEQLEKHVRSW